VNPHLHVSAEQVEMKREKDSEKNPAAFGWDGTSSSFSAAFALLISNRVIVCAVFNTESLYRSYEKRTKKLPTSSRADQEDESKTKKKDTVADVDRMVDELVTQ